MKRLLLLAAPLLCTSLLSGRPAHAAPLVEASTQIVQEGDDWLAPDGTHYAVGGLTSRIGLAYHQTPNGGFAATFEGSEASLLRTDTNETLTRLGGRLTAGPESPWYIAPQADRYALAWGGGMFADAQWHLAGGPPQGRTHDYLDESQYRVGPFACGRIRWLHPTNPAWTTNLEAWAAPALVGVTTGGVAFPHFWSAAGLRVGPTWQRDRLRLTAGVDGELWYGGGFWQRDGGLFLAAELGW